MYRYLQVNIDDTTTGHKHIELDCIHAVQRWHQVRLVALSDNDKMKLARFVPADWLCKLYSTQG